MFQSTIILTSLKLRYFEYILLHDIHFLIEIKYILVYHKCLLVSKTLKMKMHSKFQLTAFNINSN